MGQNLTGVENLSDLSANVTRQRDVAKHELKGKGVCITLKIFSSCFFVSFVAKT